MRRFLSYSKNYTCNLCKPIHDIINYSTSICPFESGKCGKEGEKLQKFEYLENEKSFLDEIKNIFYNFSVEHLRRRFFRKIVSGFYALTIFVKELHRRYSTGI